MVVVVVVVVVRYVVANSMCFLGPGCQVFGLGRGSKAWHVTTSSRGRHVIRALSNSNCCPTSSKFKSVSTSTCPLQCQPAYLLLVAKMPLSG